MRKLAIWIASLLLTASSAAVLAQTPSTAPAAAPATSAPKPTPSSSTSTTTTATKKPNTSGAIYRWTDAQGRVQYGAEVPEQYQAKSRKVDSSINIVKTPAPASIGQPPPAPAPAPQSASSQPTARKPVTEREKCEAAWQEYQASQECFNQFRRGIAGPGRGTGLTPEAQRQCKDVTEPAACR